MLNRSSASTTTKLRSAKSNLNRPQAGRAANTCRAKNRRHAQTWHDEVAVELPMDMPRQFPRRVRLRVKNQMDEQRLLFHRQATLQLRRDNGRFAILR